MNKICIYDLENQKFLGEYKSYLKAMDALDIGAVRGVEVDKKYMICQIHKIYTANISYLDITDKELNRSTSDSTSISSDEDVSILDNENDPIAQSLKKDKRSNSTFSKMDTLANPENDILADMTNFSEDSNEHNRLTPEDIIDERPKQS